MTTAVPSRDTLLSVRGLTVTFPLDRRRFAAVEGIGFDVGAGESVCIVGESGSGKSVTALAIMGLIEPPGWIASGQVVFDGADLTKADAATLRRVRGGEIGMIFQEPMTSLNPLFTVGEQIGEGLRIHEGLTRRQARQRTIELLGRVGIPGPAERVDQHPHQMSGGMRQRVMIAMALACKPKLLIADEPTTALDVTIQAQILDLILRLRDELGMAVIFITHDMGVVARVAERVIVMYAGRIVEAAPVRQLFARPEHPYTAALLACIPSLAKDGVPLPSIDGVVPSPRNLPPGCRFEQRCAFAHPVCAQHVPPLFALAAGRRSACFAHSGFVMPDASAATRYAELGG